MPPKQKALDKTGANVVHSTAQIGEILEYITKGKLGGGAYFSDGIRKVHYVIVVTRISAYRNYEVLSYMIRQLEDMGLEFEQSLGITIPAIFVKIHIPDDVSVKYLVTYDIVPEFLKDFNYSDPNPDKFTTFKTPLLNKDVFQGVEVESMSLNKVKIISKILAKIPYGSEEEQQGIQKLQKNNIIQDHFGLHDGPIQVEYWHNDDLLNERTLLAKYWANLGVWYKSQPLDLIHKYYGSEIAFYFAWSDYYNKIMLVPLTILGVILVLGSAIQVSKGPTNAMHTICTSNDIMCSFCDYRIGCKFVELNKYCTSRFIIEMLQVRTALFYAVFTNIWGIIFMKLWRRKEYNLKLRWNLIEESLQEEIDVRLEYKEKAKKVLVGRQTVYEVPKRERLFRIVAVSVSYLLANIIVWAFIYTKVVLLAILRIQLLKSKVAFNITDIVNMVSYTLQAMFTMIYSKCLQRVSLKLAHILCVKTQSRFDQLLIFLVFTMDIVNNYCPLLHSGLFKDFAYNIPYWVGPPYIRQDACDPLPCILPLFSQIATLMTLKTFIEKVVVVSYPKIKQIIKTYMSMQLKKSDMPQYEEEYSLSPTKRQMMNTYFSKRSIQYGMVMIFIYSFPLAPLCALIHNVLAIRMESNSLVYRTRRPAITKQASGIGLWKNVLTVLTILAVTLNAFIIAFAADTYEYGDIMKDFSVDKAFSIFNTNDFYGHLTESNDTCYYRGKRFPPNHEQKYHSNEDNFATLIVKLQVHIAIQTIVLVFFVLLNSLVQNLPLVVKKRCWIDRTNLDQKYNSFFNEHLEILRPNEREKKKVITEDYGSENDLALGSPTDTTDSSISVAQDEREE